MSLRREVPCMFCGHVNETALVDPQYSEYNNVPRLIGGNWYEIFDYKFVNLNCDKCKKDNWIFWYRPMNRFNPFFPQ